KERAKDSRFDQQPDQQPDRPFAPMGAEPFARLGPRGEGEAQSDGRAGCQEQNEAQETAYPAIRLDELFARHRHLTDGPNDHLTGPARTGELQTSKSRQRAGSGAASGSAACSANETMSSSAGRYPADVSTVSGDTSRRGGSKSPIGSSGPARNARARPS